MFVCFILSSPFFPSYSILLYRLSYLPSCCLFLVMNSRLCLQITTQSVRIYPPVHTVSIAIAWTFPNYHLV